MDLFTETVSRFSMRGDAPAGRKRTATGEGAFEVECMLGPGTVLQGRYRIEEMVGQGGMALVYSAYDLQFKLRVAVKQMAVASATAEMHDSILAQFEQEAQILRSLKHENIPRVYAFFEESSQYYLVMDFVDGHTLSDLMDPRADGTPARLPSLTDVLDWGCQIASALDYLHGHRPQPVIYKDLKPSNVMLTPSGRIMLLDFGLARGIDLEGNNLTILKGAGTPGFSPPEQRDTERSIQCDPRVDLYALGATLYKLLTGITPPDATEQAATGWNVFDSAATVGVPLPKDLEELLRELLAIRREDRLSSAREALERLQAIRSHLRGHNPEAPTIALAPPPQRLKGLDARKTLMAAGVGVVLLLGWLLARDGWRIPGASRSTVSQSMSPGADVPTPTPTVFKLQRLEE